MFSPLIEPSEVGVLVASEDVPKKTKGNVHAAITINNLGPFKKFLSESIIVSIL